MTIRTIAANSLTLWLAELAVLIVGTIVIFTKRGVTGRTRILSFLMLVALPGCAAEPPWRYIFWALLLTVGGVYPLVCAFRYARENGRQSKSR